MNKELLDIRPRELKFTVERKKRSLCSIQLVNNSNQYVAFKVKTTSPKNYCVQPNTGIVQPSSTCNFTVTMQAQQETPPDMQCKDKFLIQSTIVPFGTTEEDIIPSMFMKDGSKYIEENKLKVVLVTPVHSPKLQRINGTLKLDRAHEASIPRNQMLNGVENYSPSYMVASAVEELKPGKEVDSKPAKSVEEFKLEKEIEELKLAKDNEEKKLAKVTGELNSKLNEWKVKLSEADNSITKLTVEGTTIIQERDSLRQELAVLRRTNGVRVVTVGFPFLFVCMIGLIGVALGYILHS
ncbi:hypothetical protein NE237_015930 [Protea cynaroides]|uniref:MSP domain-containing protein n=1 Tax=Protea cynaroides TaxID=273540 RepID=A0A9Q0KF03_9MAGN|nr:hypothetical protein NE237_015930 [Protea cynaroides]